MLPTPLDNQRECRFTTPGTAYLGTRRHTRNFTVCQRWDSQIPHRHPYNTADYFPDLTLADAENYCRNPNDGEPGGPWCYTLNPDMRWQYCDIPYCGKELRDEVCF